MFYVYILYSELIDCYYVGYTSQEVNDRLRKHLSSHKGFTGRAKDWTIVYFETFNEKENAIAREKTIKSWKSRIKLIELIGN